MRAEEASAVTFHGQILVNPTYFSIAFKWTNPYFISCRSHLCEWAPPFGNIRSQFQESIYVALYVFVFLDAVQCACSRR